MQVEIDLIGNVQSLLPQLQLLKAANITLAQTAATTGAAYSKAFQSAGKDVSAYEAQLVKLKAETTTGTPENLALQADALRELKTLTERGTDEYKKLNAEIIQLETNIDAVAQATLVESNQFVDASNKKHAELQKEAVALQKLIELSKTKAAAGSNVFTSQVANQTAVVQKLTAEVKKEREESNKPHGSGIDVLAGKVTSLTSLVRKARTEAFAMGEAFGEDSPQAISAQKNLAELEKKLKDLSDRTAALNPEAKFAAFTQLASGIAGGFTAATGALSLFGAESDDVQKAILKVQQALAITQGLQAFSGIFSAFKNVRAVLGGTAGAIKIITQEAEHSGVEIAHESLSMAAYSSEVAHAGKEITKTAAAQKAAAAATTLWARALAFLSTPLGIALVAISAITAAILFFTRDTEKAEESVGDLIKSMGDLADEQERINTLTKSVTGDRISILKSEQAIELANAQKRGATETELFNLKKKQQEKLHQAQVEQAAQELGLLEKERQAILLNQDKIAEKKASTTDEKDLKQLDEQLDAELKRYDELTFKKAALESNFVALQHELSAETVQINADASKQILDDKKKLKDNLLQLQKELLDGLNDLTKKSNDAEIEMSGGEEKIRLMEKQANEELNVLRHKLLRQIQITEEARLITLGVPKKEAEELSKLIQFNETQEEQFNILRNAKERKFQQQRLDLQNEFVQAKMLLIEDETQKEIAQFNIEFQDKEKALRAAHVSENEIAAFYEKEGNKIIFKTQSERIDQTAKLQKDSLRLVKESGESEEAFTERTQIAQLNIELIAAESKLELRKKLAASTNDNSQKTADEIKALENEVNRIAGVIAAGIKKLEELNRNKKFSVGKLLGFTGAEADAVDQAAQSIINSINSVVDSTFAAEEALLQHRLDQSQELIRSYEEQSSALQQNLDKQLELQRKGYANSVAQAQDAINKMNQAKQKELENQKKIQKQQNDLKKEQIVLDGVVAGVQIVVAAAQTIAGWSKVPYVGWIIGIAAAAALVAEFISISNQIKSINNTQFAKGGVIGSPKGGLVGGKSHAEGGNKYVSIDGNSMIEHEAGEFVTNKKSTSKYYNVLKALNQDKPQMLSSNDLLPLLKGTGVVLKENVSQSITNHKMIVDRKIEIQKHERLTTVEGELKGIHEKIGVIEEEMTREKITHLSDGTVIHQHGNYTKVVRPND